MPTKPNIVLVHGAWADGSSWSAVIERLHADGFRVIAPQFPLTALADDVARLRQVLEFQDGPTLVVGHSYGRRSLPARLPWSLIPMLWSSSSSRRRNPVRRSDY